MKKALLFVLSFMLAAEVRASTQELIDAVKANDAAKVADLFKNGEDPNGANAQGNTALHYAVALDNAEITQILLSEGADLTAANQKGWTPLKIAEKKELKNVTPVLVRYLQLQKEAVETEQAPAAKSAPESAQNAAKVAAAPRSAMQAADEVQAEAASATVPAGQYKSMIEAASKHIADAEAAQKEAENKADALNKELASVRADNLALAAKLKAAEAELEKKTSAEKAEKVEKVEKVEKAAVPAAAETTPAETAAQKNKAAPAKAAAAKQARPAADVKKAAAKSVKKPQPDVKRVAKPAAKPAVKSVISGIYAGNEEIVYCLDYLGNGENENFKRASGYYAAASGINEARYKQIVDLSNSFWTTAEAAAVAERDTLCSGIVTPSDRGKQNLIVRSMNKAVGY